MPFRDPHLCFTEMLDSIATIDSFLDGVDFQRYCSDLPVRSAVERQLQIITEAAFRQGDDAERLCPAIDWRGIRGLGNVLRRACDVIDDELIWQTVQTRLPSLRKAANMAFAEIKGVGQS